MLENNIPYKYLQSILAIDPKSKTGLTWKKRKSTGNFNALFAEKPAGFVQSFGNHKYYLVKVAYKDVSVNIPAHRIISILKGEKVKDKVVRHLDGNTLNNDPNNLIVCTQSEFLSSRNKQENNKSGYKNVVQVGKRFLAQFTINGKRHYVGYFDKAKDANNAILQRKREVI